MTDKESYFNSYKGGFNAAVRTLYDQHYLDLIVIAIRFVHDRMHAEDIVAEVFMKLEDKKDDFMHESEVFPFLYIAVRNAGISAWRAAKKRREENEELAYLSKNNVEEDTEKIRIDTRVMQELDEQIRKLPRKCQMVFSRRFYLNETRQQIADALHMPLNTVDAHIHLAKKKLKAVFMKKDR